MYFAFTSEKYDYLYHKGFSKHPLVTTCSLFLTVMRCAVFQINTDFLLNPVNLLKNNFHWRNLIPLLHVTKTALSIADVSWSIDFLPHFYYFSAVFTVFLPAFIVIRFCYISNQYRLSNKSGKFQWDMPFNRMSIKIHVSFNRINKSLLINFSQISWYLHSEVVDRWCSVKKLFLEISQN